MMKLYGTDDKHAFWWDPPTREDPYGRWNITEKGAPAPLGGFINKQLIERGKQTRFDHPGMVRAGGAINGARN